MRLRIFTLLVGRRPACCWNGEGCKSGGRWGEDVKRRRTIIPCYGLSRGHASLWHLRSTTFFFFLSFKIFKENSSTPSPAWGSSRRLWLTLPTASFPAPPRPPLQPGGSAAVPAATGSAGRGAGAVGMAGLRGLAALSRRTERTAWGLTRALPVAAAGQLAFFFLTIFELEIRHRERLKQI